MTLRLLLILTLLIQQTVAWPCAAAVSGVGTDGAELCCSSTAATHDCCCSVAQTETDLCRCILKELPLQPKLPSPQQPETAKYVALPAPLPIQWPFLQTSSIRGASLLHQPATLSAHERCARLCIWLK